MASAASVFLYTLAAAALLLAPLHAEAAPAPAVQQRNFNEVQVTASLQQIVNGSIVPGNLFSVAETSMRRGALFDAAWLNVQLNSTTVPVHNQHVEFGFGVATPRVNLTVTLDVFDDGQMVYKIACYGPAGLYCNVTSAFAVDLSIVSPALIGGAASLQYSNVSSQLQPDVTFNSSAGNLTFIVGPLSANEAIATGSNRELIFQLTKVFNQRSVSGGPTVHMHSPANLVQSLHCRASACQAVAATSRAGTSCQQEHHAGMVGGVSQST